MRFVHTAMISAPIAEVFLHLDDTARMRNWMPGLVEVTYDKPGVPRGVGTRFVHRVRRGSDVAEYPGQVTAYRPPSELGMQLELVRYGMETIYRLKAEPGGTRVEQISTVAPKTRLARTLSIVARLPLRRRQHRLLRSLQQAAEGVHQRDSRA